MAVRDPSYMLAALAPYLGETRQVHQSQVEDMRGVYLQVDWLPGDALVAPSDPSCLVLDLALHIGEVVESPVGNVVEFGPLIAAGRPGVSVGDADGVDIGLILGDVDELQNQGSPRDDAASAGQEISSHDILQHRRLSSGL